MVDYNNETTITQAPADIIKIQLLEMLKYIEDAKEHYLKNKYNGIKPTIAILKSRLYVLFDKLKPNLEEQNISVEELEKGFESKEYDDLNEVYKAINKYYYKIQLTKINHRKVYDTTIIENENIEKGL